MNGKKFIYWTIVTALHLLSICYADALPGKDPPVASRPLPLKGQQPMAPKITEQPSDEIALVSKATTLYCRAVGFPKPTITWFRNSSPLTNFKERHVTLLSTGLVFIRIQNKGEWANTGTYQCKAENRLGTVFSRNATVDLASISNDFRLEPSDKVAAVGSSVVIECEGPKGVPEPTISWKKDSENLNMSDRIKLLSGGSIQINDLKNSDSGSFECVASNMAGTKTSTGAFLQVLDPPRPEIEPPVLTASLGQTIEATCKVDGDSRINWSKREGKLPARFSAFNNGTMRIDGIALNDAGEYVCTAENLVGKVTASLSLTVHVKPKFTNVVRSTRVGIGDTISIPCRAEGSPKPDIIWRDFRGNEMLVENTYLNGHVLIDSRGNLLIFSAQIEDSGVYKCQAINQIGTISTDVTLIVEKSSQPFSPPPLLAIVPSNITAQVGGQLRLDCHSNSNPRPDIVWLKNNNRIGTKYIQNRISKLPNGSLSINSVQFSDAGPYTCKAENKNGITEWPAWIKVVADESHTSQVINGDYPNAPNQPVLVNSTSSSVTLSWTLPEFSSPIDFFVIDYYRLENFPAVWNHISSVRSRQHTINQLLPSSEYVFVVRAVNEGIVSKPSVKSNVIETQDISFKDLSSNKLDHVSIKLARVLVDSNLSGAVTLEWQTDSVCDVIDGFVVNWEKVTVPRRRSASHQVDCSSKSYKLTNLIAETKYEIRIRPFKGNIMGRTSPIVFITAEQGIVQISPPLLSYQSDVENHQIFFQWQTPDDLPATYVTEYILHCYSQDGTVDRTITVNGSTFKATVTNLPTEKTYLATVQYTTELGEGISSDMETIALESNKDSFAAFMQTPAAIAISSAVILVILIAAVVGIYCFVKSKRNCKSRSRQAPYFSFMQAQGSRTSDNRHHNGQRHEDFRMEHAPMIPQTIVTTNNPSVYYKKGEVTTSVDDVTSGHHPFSYVTDQLTSRNNIPTHFSGSSQLPQQRQQALQYTGPCSSYAPPELIQSEQDGNVCSAYPGLPISAYKIDDIPPQSQSNVSTQNTGFSDRSQGSSGVRSVSDRSAKSGQSSRRFVGSSSSNNIASKVFPIQNMDASNRLHGCQPRYENTRLVNQQHVNPPTPPARDESYLLYGNESNFLPNQNYEKLICSTRKPSNSEFQLNSASSRSNTTALIISSGNGYGSESDIRESSCEHESSQNTSSDDESLELESVSQVGQNTINKEPPSICYRPSIQPPLPKKDSSRFIHPLHERNPDLSSFSTTKKDKRDDLVYPSTAGARYLNNTVPAESSNKSNHNGRKKIEMYNPKIPSSKATGPTTLELLACNRNTPNEAPESLRLDIKNALNPSKTNGDHPSPSSPTESSVSEHSGYMSTASSNWQFQLPSCVTSNTNGKLAAPTYQRLENRRLRPNINAGSLSPSTIPELSVASFETADRDKYPFSLGHGKFDNGSYRSSSTANNFSCQNGQMQ